MSSQSLPVSFKCTGDVFWVDPRSGGREAADSVACMTTPMGEVSKETTLPLLKETTLPLLTPTPNARRQSPFWLFNSLRRKLGWSGLKHVNIKFKLAWLLEPVCPYMSYWRLRPDLCIIILITSCILIRASISKKQEWEMWKWWKWANSLWQKLQIGSL